MLCGFLNSRYLDALHLADEWGCTENPGGCYQISTITFMKFGVHLCEPLKSGKFGGFATWPIQQHRESGAIFTDILSSAGSRSNSNIAAGADSGSSSDVSPCIGTNIVVSFNSVAKLIAARGQIPGKTARESTGVSSRLGRQYPLAANSGRFQS